jgi:hypothetical protein
MSATKRIPHILKGQTKTVVPASLLFFDTETKPNAQSRKGSVEYHQLWFGYAKHSRFENGKHTRNSELFFQTTDEFWQYVFSKTDAKRPLYCFAHNLGFDATIVDIFGAMDRYNITCRYYILDDPPNYIQLEWNGRVINFVDTFNFWKCSVAQLGKSLGLDKLAFPSDTDTMETWKKYCKIDVEIIEKSITNLFGYLKRYDLGSFAISAPSISYATYKKCFMKHQIMIHDNSRALQLERNSYYGGLVKNFFIGKVRREPITCLDVNSLYPFVMQGDFPTKLVKHYKKLTVKELERFARDFGIVARVKIKTTKNVYPKRHNGRLCDVSGKFTTWLAGPELKQALERKEVVGVDECSIYEMEPIFKAFIDYFWGQRRQFKNEGNGVQEQFCKLIMNSLYGKFGQHGHQWADLTAKNLQSVYHTYGIEMPKGYSDDYIKGSFQNGVSQWFAKDLPEPISIRCVGNKVQMKLAFNEHMESSPIIASYVTSYARCYLRQLIADAGEQNVYYCDTDSLFVNNRGKSLLIAKGHVNDKELGKLKIEKVEMNCEFHGPKDYLFGEKVVCKGIKKNAKKLAPNQYQQLQFEGLKSVIKRKGKPYITIKTVVKKVSREYNKGTKLPSGRIAPYMLDE